MREPTNGDRAARVRNVLDSYMDQDTSEYGVIDLLADMMHYCHHEDIGDFDRLVRIAKIHFEAEVWREDSENAKADL